MDSTSLTTVDENARRRFEAAWRDGRPGPLEQFLPDPEHPCFLATLEELVHIEMEFGWKARGDGPGTAVGPPPLVEGYLARFPCLDRPAAVRRLLRQEYWARHRYGDRPPADEYRRRFPQVSLGAEDIDTAPAESPRAPEVTRIPGYEILGVLGRGGMGLVYHARQLNPPRPVALKVVLAGAHASAEALSRCRREAEAAAGLQHPHIVQVYGVGDIPGADGKPSGLPYFSLEFVSGGTLAQWAAGKPQSPRAAAGLVRTLAEAIHYAHERGVIHRDLKPANVLLWGQGRRASEQDRTPFLQDGADPDAHPAALPIPKVTDFGLAKCLAADSDLTRTGDVIGTPNYMAPEQAAGKAREVGPAADVYSLGAILYELLTGRPPFLGETPPETMLRVLHEEPVPVRRLQPKVPRDLETITLKCLRKQPGKRYASARELAGDLGRFLAGEPVRARPTPHWERALKWARRRPAAAALLGFALLATVCVALGVLWHTAQLSEALQTAEDRRKEAERESRRAEANFARASAVVDEMVSWVGQQRLADVPHMEQARRDILQKALRLYQDLLREKGTDPAVRWRVGVAHARVGEVHRLLGRPELGEKAYSQAVPILRELVAEAPAVSLYRQSLASTLYDRGILRKDARRAAEAEEDVGAALALRRRLVADFPSDPEHRRTLADALNLLGILRWQTGRRPEAEQAYREAIALRRRLVQDDPSASHRQVLAMTLTNLGWLLAASGRTKEAEATYREALGLQEKVAAELPAVAGCRQDLAGTLYNLGRLLAVAGRAREAEPLLRRSRDLRARLVADFPTRPDYRRELGLSCYQLAELLWLRGEAAEGERLYADALAACEKLVADFPNAVRDRTTLALYQGALPRALVKRGCPGEAEKAYRLGLVVYERLAKKLPDVPQWQRWLGDTLEKLGRLAALREDRAEAPRLFRKAAEHRRAFLKANPADPEARRALRATLGTWAEILVRLGQHAEAARVAEERSGLAPEGWQHPHWAASLLCRCVRLAAKDLQFSAAERVRLVRAYGDRAVELLREARRRGLPGGPQLRAESAFEPLRQRADFQKVVTEPGPGK
jgi:serine/threonine protein kinase